MTKVARKGATLVAFGIAATAVYLVMFPIPRTTAMIFAFVCGVIFVLAMQRALRR